MSNDINFEDKLKALHLEDHSDNFLKSQINILYDKFIKNKELNPVKNNEETLLFLINIILKKIGLESINNILDFKVEKQKIYLFDGYNFVKNYNKELDKLNVKIDFKNYDKKTKTQKKYFNLEIVKKIFKSRKYELELYRSTALNPKTNVRTSVQKYRINIE